MTTLAQMLAAISALATPPEAPPQRAEVPWQVGERLEYQVKFSAFSVGTGFDSRSTTLTSTSTSSALVSNDGRGGCCGCCA